MVQATARLNNLPSVQQKLVIKRLHLRPLPVARLAKYTALVVHVSSASTTESRQLTSSVPSRLIGHQLRVHLCHYRSELFRFSLTL